MPINLDYRDLFRIFSEEKVEYLIVGAYAVTYFSEPRYTKDLDLWVRPSPANASKVWKSLLRFGAPLAGVTARDFTDRQMVYQVGIEPNRIDILMDIAGVEFQSAFENRVESTYGGVPIFLIGREDLIAAKKASGRPQDLLDLERLIPPG